MEKYFKVPNTWLYLTSNGKSYVSHEDQVDIGVHFYVVGSQDGFDYVRATGNEESINNWKYSTQAIEIEENIFLTLTGYNHGHSEYPISLEEIDILEESLDLVILEMLGGM